MDVRVIPYDIHLRGEVFHDGEGHQPALHRQ
jgi:hypothetical protein